VSRKKIKIKNKESFFINDVLKDVKKRMENEKMKKKYKENKM